MKKIICLVVIISIVMSSMMITANAQTGTFFNDTFENGTDNWYSNYNSFLQKNAWEIKTDGNNQYYYTDPGTGTNSSKVLGIRLKNFVVEYDMIMEDVGESGQWGITMFQPDASNGGNFNNTGTRISAYIRGKKRYLVEAYGNSNNSTGTYTKLLDANYDTAIFPVFGLGETRKVRFEYYEGTINIYMDNKLMATTVDPNNSPQPWHIALIARYAPVGIDNVKIYDYDTYYKNLSFAEDFEKSLYHMQSNGEWQAIEETAGGNKLMHCTAASNAKKFYALYGYKWENFIAEFDMKITDVNSQVGVAMFADGAIKGTGSGAYFNSSSKRLYAMVSGKDGGRMLVEGYGVKEPDGTTAFAKYNLKFTNQIPSAFVADSTHKVKITHNNGEINVYIDDTLVGTKSYSGSQLWNLALYTQYGSVKIDNFKVVPFSGMLELLPNQPFFFRETVTGEGDEAETTQYPIYQLQDGKIIANINVPNIGTQTTYNVRAVFAVYKTSGDVDELLSMSISEQVSVAPGQIQKLTGVLNVPADDAITDYKIMTFLWNGLEAITPITEKYVF